ncbi:pyridoxamine 5'-phosphate oxidase family protein [Rhizobium sp. Pop5]|uniref:pyridoxamine 5'-phosphate oxidase family protein n=1 Tax=Rhizobium sp. Pop5 TaxID=1223565 RepID=UPI000A448BD6|nr:pyridoxamine 5'-phosphate oxidase family protein [Rhizobium sp. Pop5]UVD55707.1 pyridoxamine 5'-phosphate oxidase family protein [Rhizobium sp. Pop5]
MAELQYLGLIWDRLRSMADGSAPSAAIQLATVSSTGSPSLRTVILREANFDEATISFITDIRSTKVGDVRRDPRVSAISYDLESRVQIKLVGTAAVVDEEAARQAMWQRLRPHTREEFERELPPGILLHPDSGNAMGWEYDGDAPKERYDRYALVAISVASAEWLDVSGKEHVRFAFYRDRRPKWRAVRLSP